MDFLASVISFPTLSFCHSLKLKTFCCHVALS
uniref:Uncharacterized protein n=1 Tax=Arundo donax TaxID=35708 RepID=A0A0A9B8C0_ARUDO